MCTNGCVASSVVVHPPSYVYSTGSEFRLVPSKADLSLLSFPSKASSKPCVLSDSTSTAAPHSAASSQNLDNCGLSSIGLVGAGGLHDGRQKRNRRYSDESGNSKKSKPAAPGAWKHVNDGKAKSANSGAKPIPNARCTSPDCDSAALHCCKDCKKSHCSRLPRLCQPQGGREADRGRSRVEQGLPAVPEPEEEG